MCIGQKNTPKVLVSDLGAKFIVTSKNIFHLPYIRQLTFTRAKGVGRRLRFMSVV